MSSYMGAPAAASVSAAIRPIIAAKPSGSNFTIRAGYGYGPTVHELGDETKRQMVDGHIDRALSELRRAPQGLSRNDFADEVQRRVTMDLGAGFPVRDRIDEILDTFMSRDDST